MKITLITILCTVAISSVAQHGKRMQYDQKGLLKLGVNTYFVGDEFPLSISYEKKIAARESIELGVLPRLRKDAYENISGVGFNLAYRKYISKGRTGLQGLYIMPNIRYGSLSTKDSIGEYTNSTTPPYYIYKPRTITTTNVAIGINFGHQWVYKSGLTIDISGGIGFFRNNSKGTNLGYSGRFLGKEYGITPQLSIKIGYAF